MSEALFTYRVSVSTNWIDFNGHMGDYAYGIVFSNAATAFMDRIGVNASYRATNNATLYTLDSRIGYVKECHSNEELKVELSVIDVDNKRMHIFMRMLNKDGQETAFCEQVLIHVSRETGVPRASDMPILTRESLLADLERPRTAVKRDWLMRRIGLERK